MKIATQLSYAGGFLEAVAEVQELARFLVQTAAASVVTGIVEGNGGGVPRLVDLDLTFFDVVEHREDRALHDKVDVLGAPVLSLAPC